MSPPKCRSCKARIRWVRTAAKGKAMPLDPKPNEAGNVAMRDGLAVVLGNGSLDLAQARAEGETLWMSHWATCPYRERHRAEVAGNA